MTNPCALSFDAVSVSYTGRDFDVPAVQDLTLSVFRGERLGLVGESGSGKTTAALAALGMLRAPGRIVGGKIELDGREITHLGPAGMRSIRLAELAYIPQGAMNSLNPVVRIRTSFRHAFADHGVQLGEDAAERRMQDLLSQVDLDTSVADMYPHQLSGGMKQRVCIALAICLDPKVIIADEPTSALDVITQRHVMGSLEQVRSRLGCSMILIGHDMGLMAQSVDRIAVMKGGQLVEVGSTKDIFQGARHDYTRELIASVPVIGGERTAGKPVGIANSEGPEPLLAFSGAGVSYKGKRGGGGFSLKPMNLAVMDGQPRIVSVVGQSGSGKTTVGALALGFLSPSFGNVKFKGKDLQSLCRKDHSLFRSEVQAIFQDPYSSYNPFYRVRRSLELPLRKLQRGHLSETSFREKATAACAAVGLDANEVLDRFVHQLSGGQRQRLMVARAIMLRPKLLIADEPVSMVDASLRVTILDHLVRLRDDYGISVLYITHDLATAYRISDEILVMHRGEVVEAGDPVATLLEPEHPYTRLLLKCLPWPDPARTWSTSESDRRLIDELSPLTSNKTIMRGHRRVWFQPGA